jgi:hypothetical protein
MPLGGKRMICKECNTDKPTSEFYWHKAATRSKGYFDSYCKTCRTRRQRDARALDPDKFKGYTVKSRYGISLDKVNEMLEDQHGRCAICKDKFDMTKERPFAIDHDHSHCSNQKACSICVRGLLCPQCNQMLGFARERIDVLDAAKQYLKNYRLET